MIGAFYTTSVGSKQDWLLTGQIGIADHILDMNPRDS
jgi:hypothetical protein